MSLSLLYTRGTTAPAIALPEEGLPTQRVFSQGTMADSEDGGAAPILLGALVPQHGQPGHCSLSWCVNHRLSLHGSQGTCGPCAVLGCDGCAVHMQMLPKPRSIPVTLS